MSKQRFAEMWEEYEGKILPMDASRVQVQETRRAFYAGGIALFYELMSMLTEDAEPTEEDIRNLDAIKNEFDAYARDLAEGRA